MPEAGDASAGALPSAADPGEASADSRLRVLLYSSVFPSPTQPSRGQFTRQLAVEMARRAEVEVVCPVPWCPDLRLLEHFPDWRALAQTPHSHPFDGGMARYPRYPMLPKFGGAVQPRLQAAAVQALIERMHQRRPIDVINAHWVFPDGVAAVRMGRRLGIPVVLTALGCDINEYPRYALRRRQIFWALAHCDAVSAVSPQLVDRIVALGIDAERAHWIANGVDAGQFYVRPDAERSALRAQRGLPLQRPQLLYVGRLAPEKAVRTLLQALARLDRSGRLGFDTVLVGDGPQRRYIERDIVAHGLASCVRVVGEVGHAEIPEWMACAHALCLPSLREGTPNVVLEATACGLPVVASRVGPIPSLVDETRGALAAPGDADDLADALTRVMTRSWDASAIAASSSAQSWSEVAQRYLSLMREVAGTAADPAGAPGVDAPRRGAR